MKIDELPRKALTTYLDFWRVPQRYQVVIKDAAANLLRDDTLKADAKLQKAALEEKQRARNADAKYEQKKHAAQDAKREVVKRDQQREQAVEKTAAVKKAAVQRQAAAKQKVVAKQATSAKREELAEESKALNDQRAAAEAKAEVLDLEDKLDQVKAARKSG